MALGNILGYSSGSTGNWHKYVGLLAQLIIMFLTDRWLPTKINLPSVNVGVGGFHSWWRGLAVKLVQTWRRHSLSLWYVLSSALCPKFTLSFVFMHVTPWLHSSPLETDLSGHQFDGDADLCQRSSSEWTCARPSSSCKSRLQGRTDAQWGRAKYQLSCCLQGLQEFTSWNAFGASCYLPHLGMHSTRWIWAWDLCGWAPWTSLLFLGGLQLSWFPFILYDTDWMGREIYHGNPKGTTAEIDAYNRGVRQGAFGLLLNSVRGIEIAAYLLPFHQQHCWSKLCTCSQIVLGVTSFLIEPMCRKVGSRVVWAASNFMVFVCMAATAVVSVWSSKEFNGSIQQAITADSGVRATALVLFAVLGVPLAVSIIFPMLLPTFTHRFQTLSFLLLLLLCRFSSVFLSLLQHSWLSTRVPVAKVSWIGLRSWCRYLVHVHVLGTHHVWLFCRTLHWSSQHLDRNSSGMFST